MNEDPVSFRPAAAIEGVDPVRPADSGETIFVLPSEFSDGRPVYRAESEGLVKLLRAEGIDARFRHGAADRSWRVLLGETEALFVLSVAASVVGAAIWSGVAAAIQKLVKNSGEPGVTIRLHVTRSDGTDLWLQASGDPDAVVEALEQVPSVLKDASGDDRR